MSNSPPYLTNNYKSIKSIDVNKKSQPLVDKLYITQNEARYEP